MPRSRESALARSAAIFVIAPAILLGVSCSDEADDGVPPLTWAQLRNASYPSSIAPGDELQLVNGVVEETVDGGARPRARLADIGAFGEIDGGRTTDSAVFLVEAAGSDEWVTSLVAVLNEDGAPVAQPPALVGQNVIVVGVTIGDGEITTRVRARDSVDRSDGTVDEITRTSALDDGQLVIRDESRRQLATAAPADFSYTRTAVDTSAGAGEVELSLAPRQSQTYVLPGAAGQQLSVAAASAFDSAILSVQGLSDGLSVVQHASYSTTFSGALPATQSYSIRVLSVAGEDLQVRLSYGLTPPDVSAAATPLPVPTPAGAAELARAVPRGGVSGLSAPDQSLAALSPPALDYMSTRAPARGIAVVTADDGVIYAENADQQLETASVIKVVVMTCVMHRAEGEGRLVDEWELSMMWPMITWSDNDATDALWNDLGGGPGVTACLQALDVGGITPYIGPYWGTSTASARGIAVLMGRLAFGELVNPVHRAVALELLTNVTEEQRWGVPAGADESGDEIVGVKDGWYPDDDGWRVNSVGFISPLAAGLQPYAIGVMTNNQSSMEYGIETIEGLARPVYEALRAE